MMPRPELYETRSDSTLSPHTAVAPESRWPLPPLKSSSSPPLVPDQKPDSYPVSQEPLEEMPDWWKSDFNIGMFPPLGYPLRFFFRLACVTAIGHVDLQDVWAACDDLEKWKDLRGRLASRVAVITLVASLVLSTTATFLCATPPRRDLLDLTQKAPYICLLLALAFAADSVLVGASLAYVAAEFTSDWFKNTLMSSRSRVYCTLVMVAFPLCTLICSMVVCAVGLFIAAWSTGSRLLHVWSIIILVLPIPLVPMFMWTQVPVAHVLVRKKMRQEVV